MSRPGYFRRIIVRYADGTPKEWRMVTTSAQRRRNRRAARRDVKHMRCDDAPRLWWVRCITQYYDGRISTS